jgi:hypothetical protein
MTDASSSPPELASTDRALLARLIVAGSVVRYDMDRMDHQITELVIEHFAGSPFPPVA